MTEPTCAVEPDIDVCSHGRPDHQELVRQVREAAGMFAGAMPITPKEAFERALAEIEDFRSILSEIAGGEVAQQEEPEPWVEVRIDRYTWHRLRDCVSAWREREQREAEVEALVRGLRALNGETAPPT